MDLSISPIVYTGSNAKLYTQTNGWHVTSDRCHLVDGNVNAQHPTPGAEIDASVTYAFRLATVQAIAADGIK